jgi:eukaryotic-like serine/threonine-protein kinase
MNDSQKMPRICQIFLSCVTNEFLPHREMLTKDLCLPQVKVQVQEDFTQSGYSTLENLDDYIKGCAAVIHLIGSATGSNPASTEVVALLKRYPDFSKRIPCLQEALKETPATLSYTQWEAWLAIYHKIPCYVYQAESTSVRAPGFVENADQRRIQEEHWNRFCSHGQNRATFRDEQHLSRLVLRSLSNILPSGNLKLTVIPKGLRSFDANDSDFFLDLLPGPRDKDGLPESIRFWKHRIEQRDEATFTVGVIYGPSGCGKSSLVKAGLLPRLGTHVLSVFVEATANDTETRLLNGLRKKCPGSPNDLDLIATIADLKSGQRLESGQKILLVIDQFEQWLHAKRSEQNTELVQALRQCDGEHVQCVVLVREDYWLTARRFMGELQIKPDEDQNLALVDLFDPMHARNILAAFGRGFGRVNEPASKEQEMFFDQAVAGLSQDGRVISVRLALFAEMVKGKPWTPATWKEVGGTEGIGVTFLEDTFSSAKAGPRHRLHQSSVRSVLKALLPEQGSAIKGNMQSYDRLLQASGYAKRPNDFEELLRILDNELRLITPTDPAGADDCPAATQVSEKFYQLTHDYLVRSLRDWLTRKQKETRRGRAELLLADRAVVWNGRPENRQLPSLRQWLSICWLTAWKTWTPPQRKMMRKASRYHALRGMVVGLLIASTTFTGLSIREQVEERHSATHANDLVHAVLNADTSQTPAIIDEMADYRQWTDRRLHEEYDKAADKSPRKLNASLALLPVDPTQVHYLYKRLLDVSPQDVPVIRDALASHKDALIDKLWGVVEMSDRGKEQRALNAACALAIYDVPDKAEGPPRWQTASKMIVDELLAAIQKNPSHYGTLLDLLRPARATLLSPLTEVYRKKERSDSERFFAANILADYAADDLQMLANLLMDADEKQFSVIDPKFKEQGELALPLLTAEIDKKLPPDLPSSDKEREKLAKRKANAAVALLRMNQPQKVWPLLQRNPPDDPRVRSYLIHKLGPLGADAKVIVRRLEAEDDVTIRRALFLSLGEYNEKDLPLDARSVLVSKLQVIYGKEADPGLHAASEWLLRKWEQEAWLKQENEKWTNDKAGREHREEGIKQLLAKRKENAPPQWYINSQGQTFVVIPGPLEFMMGAPKSERDWEDDEVQRKVRIGQSFAIAAKSVTVAQYRDLTGDKHKIGEKYTYDPNLPVVGISWYMAAQYCNLLSEKEGLETCYEIKGATDVKLKAGYLGLTGYRLPTEAEMEYATRAGAATSRYYGETEELLPQYAWYLSNANNKTRPGAGLKPNDLGLFDMQGNVYIWCQERYPEGDRVVDDKEDTLSINQTKLRVVRGGSFHAQASLVRSAYRYGYLPSARLDGLGFRLSRTFVMP